MKMRHIELFRAVMQHGGFTRAAAATGDAQPNVSRAIAALERDVGFALFVRDHRRALPTPEGEALYREIERSFAGLDRLRMAAADIRAFGTGRLRVACLMALSLDVAPRTLRRFAALFPEATVSFQARPSSQVWDYTAGGQCDIGFAGPKEGFTGVEATDFLALPGVVVLPRGHALTRKTVIEPRDLAGERFLSLALEDPTRHVIDGVFQQASIERRLLIDTQPEAMLCAMVAENLGVSIVSPITAADQGHRGIVARPFSVDIPFIVQLLTPQDRPTSKLACAFIDQMRKECELARAGTRPSVPYPKRATKTRA